MNRVPVAEAKIYSTFGDDPDLASIIELFVDELPNRAAEMERCLQRLDWDGVRQAAHQLKGAAGSYGYQPITDAAARLEITIKQNDSQTAIQDALDEVADLCRRARVRPTN
jgi:HPt (histidine-containing phosphotransfer) domain-containing protein